MTSYHVTMVTDLTKIVPNYVQRINKQLQKTSGADVLYPPPPPTHTPLYVRGLIVSLLKRNARRRGRKNACVW